MDFQSFFLVLGVLAIAATLVSLRREHIRPEYSVSWLGVGVILICLGLFPHALDGFARGLGLDPGIVFPVAGGVLVFALVFETSHSVSRLRDENVMLAQRLAILEYQVQRTPEAHAQNGQ